MKYESTICAPATAPGSGAIGIIRLSGPRSVTIADKVFKASGKAIKLTRHLSQHIIHGTIRKETEILDEVLVTVFRAPHSYTGEDVVEIYCHGSPFILSVILQLLIKHGAVMAKPGEFTQRAFLNGKMDLSQAEAVADLIAAGSEAAHRLAIDQMRGGFSMALEKLREKLLKFTSLIELELDFAEEDVEFANRKELFNLIQEVESKITTLTESFKTGNAIKNGIPVAIVGETNVGKSTLLNTLLRDDKAIVSEIHGTTRDTIEDTMTLSGITFRFIDTAGIRHTEDAIETLGIERTYKSISKARIVLFLAGIDSPPDNMNKKLVEIRKRITSQKLIVLLNKIDLISKDQLENLKKAIKLMPDELLFAISAKKYQHIDQLEAKLVELSGIGNISNESVIVTNLRHYEALVKAEEAIKRTHEGLANGLPGDLLAQDIRECMYYLGEITGPINTDDILGYIFKNFCIGK
ncbi:MAG: tRNA uridine-5-carboxymethylaminomethyl(34) synthesis GTPase MnmE [Bacteroidales bacterium]|nr:tRNA uridine-5-carboxymethylaminomethyl(34) synthesis GTPase MnmE [Bacteroidales bacterium]